MKRLHVWFILKDITACGRVHCSHFFKSNLLLKITFTKSTNQSLQTVLPFHEFYVVAQSFFLLNPSSSHLLSLPVVNGVCPRRRRFALSHVLAAHLHPCAAPASSGLLLVRLTTSAAHTQQTPRASASPVFSLQRTRVQTCTHGTSRSATKSADTRVHTFSHPFFMFLRFLLWRDFSRVASST